MQTDSNLPTEERNNLLPELDLKVYVRIFWHWLWLIVLCSVMAAAAAYVASIFSVPIYQASTTLMIDEARSPTANYQDLLTSERIARTYVELIKRPVTLAQVAQQFGVTKEVLEEAITDVTVTSIRDTQLIKITIEGISPELVVAVADTLPQVFSADVNDVQTQRFAESKRSREQQLKTLDNQIELLEIEIDEISKSPTAEEEIRLNQLQDDLAQYKSSYAATQRSYEELELAEMQSTDNVVVVEKAEIPTDPIRPRILINTLLAAIVGLMLAIGIVFLIEYLDDRIKTPHDLHSVIDTPIVGTITRMAQPTGWRKQDANTLRQKSLITLHEPRHPITEAYRNLRTNLQFSNVDETLQSLLVTSAMPGEGKTTTAGNLAIVLAQAGHAVILVDADMRKPQQHKIFDLPKSPGIAEAIVANNTPIAFFLRDTPVPNLRILTSGKTTPNPAELLGSKRMKQLIESLRAEADILIFDAPPVLAVTDALVLVNQVQGVLLVVDTAQTARAVVARAAEALMRVNTQLFGVVLNRLVSSPRGYYYYNDSYYTYEEESPEQAEPTTKQGHPQTAEMMTVVEPSQAILTKKLLPKPEVNGVYELRSDKPKL